MKNKTNSDNSSSSNGNGATTSNNDNLNNTKCDNIVTEETNPDNSIEGENIMNSNNSNTKLDDNEKKHADDVPSTNFEDNNMNTDLRECSMATMISVPSQRQTALIIGTTLIKPDATDTPTQEVAPPALPTASMSAPQETHCEEKLTQRKMLSKLY